MSDVAIKISRGIKLYLQCTILLYFRQVQYIVVYQLIELVKYLFSYLSCIEVHFYIKQLLWVILSFSIIKLLMIIFLPKGRVIESKKHLTDLNSHNINLFLC